jgi:hypothetical protein
MVRKAGYNWDKIRKSKSDRQRVVTVNIDEACYEKLREYAPYLMRDGLISATSPYSVVRYCIQFFVDTLIESEMQEEWESPSSAGCVEKKE